MTAFSSDAPSLSTGVNIALRMRLPCAIQNTRSISFSTVQDYQRTLLASQGYCELGMFDDAIAELDTLPPSKAADPGVLEMRIIILTQARRWQEALEASEMLKGIVPAVAAGYIHTAFCMHELGRSSDAREVLLTGPSVLREEPTFYYNLACYECVLGNLDEARARLAKSISMDKRYKEVAKSDPDLARLRAKA